MGREEFGSAGVLWGLVARLGSGLNMVSPCDWEPEMAIEHKLPNLASKSGRRWPAGWDSSDDRNDRQEWDSPLEDGPVSKTSRTCQNEGHPLALDTRVIQQ